MNRFLWDLDTEYKGNLYFRFFTLYQCAEKWQKKQRKGKKTFQAHALLANWKQIEDSEG